MANVPPTMFSSSGGNSDILLQARQPKALAYANSGTFRGHYAEMTYTRAMVKLQINL